MWIFISKKTYQQFGFVKVNYLSLDKLLGIFLNKILWYYQKMLNQLKFFSGTAWQAEIIRDMLLDNEIESYLGDEIWGMDAPMKSAPDVVGSISVFVDREDLQDAKIVVERYYEEDFISEEEL